MLFVRFAFLPFRLFRTQLFCIIMIQFEYFHIFDCCVSRVLNSASTDRVIHTHTPIAPKNEYLLIDFLYDTLNKNTVAVLSASSFSFAYHFAQIT